MTGLKIGLVGPCAAGKSTLREALRARGFHARHIAQEHSYAQDMWKRVGRPDVLIFLDVSFAESTRRRQTSWELGDYEEEQARLRHAREHADLYITTDGMAPEEVLEAVLDFLQPPP